MPQSSPIKDERDAFWNRVRASLAAMRPGRRDAREPAYGTAAIARAREGRGRLDDVLRGAWDRCAAGKVPLCVMVIEVDRFRELHHAYDAQTIETAMGKLHRTIRSSLSRPGDTCMRHGRGGFVVVLPDYPVLMAAKLAKAMAGAVSDMAIAHKESHAGVVTVSCGVVGIDPQGNVERSVFEAAMAALARGQRRGLGQVEMVDLRAKWREQRAG